MHLTPITTYHRYLHRASLIAGLFIAVQLCVSGCGRFQPSGKAKQAVSPHGIVKAPPTKQIAWVLGSKLSAAALVYNAKGPNEFSTDLIQRSKIMADALGTVIPPFPDKTGNTTKDSAAILFYILNSAGKSIGNDLRNTHGKDHAVLFELAMKSRLLMLLYFPGSDEGIGQVIEDRAKRVGLPEHLWKPVVDSITARASQDDVKRAVGKMHQDIDAYLAN